MTQPLSKRKRVALRRKTRWTKCRSCRFQALTVDRFGVIRCAYCGATWTASGSDR